MKTYFIDWDIYNAQCEKIGFSNSVIESNKPPSEVYTTDQKEILANYPPKTYARARCFTFLGDTLPIDMIRVNAGPRS
jgi:hypothetical protein